MGYKIGLVSDGWKRRACGQGMSLMNFLITAPDGTAIFWQVQDVSGLEKTAEAICAWHLDVMKAILGIEGEVDGELSNEAKAKIQAHFSSVCMDSPSVNRKALKLIEGEVSSIVCITCQAHALNLLVKDFSKLRRDATNAKQDGKRKNPNGSYKPDNPVAVILHDVAQLSVLYSQNEHFRLGEPRPLHRPVPCREP